MTENSFLFPENPAGNEAVNKLRETELRLAILIGNLNNVVLYETGGGREFVTQNIFNLLGYPPEKFTEDRKFFTTLIHPDDAKAMGTQLEKWYDSGTDETLKLEFRCRKSNGDYIWLEDYVNYINPPGDEPYMTGVLIDISERKETENFIKKSLKEKEILLKEIHHRVNNNLQVISSLLKIQLYNANEDINKEIFKETLNRIRSMAVIHQLTSKSNNLAKIDLNDYVTELSKYFLESYNKKDINFKVNPADPIKINIDIAVPCGLLINELISIILNSKINKGKKVNIEYDLVKNFETEEIILKLHGKNCLNEYIDPFENKSLGFQLITTLNDQIDGRIETDYSDGIKFTVTFKDNQYIERLN